MFNNKFQWKIKLSGIEFYDNMAKHVTDVRDATWFLGAILKQA